MAPPQQTCCESLELVVAWYQEDLSWLPDVVRRTRPRAVYVYDKGGHGIDGEWGPGAGADTPQWLREVQDLGLAATVEVQSLPNVGRECHTYLHHLLRRYKDEATAAGPAAEDHAKNVADAAARLPENRIVMFLQGHPHDHLAQYALADPADLVALCYADALRSGISKSTLGTVFVQPDFKISVHNGRAVGQPDPLTYQQWFERHVGAAQFPRDRLLWWTAAQFAVSWSHLLARPAAYYAGLIALLQGHMDPECVHFFERSWYYILDRSAVDYTIIPFDSGLAGGDQQQQQQDWSRPDLRGVYLRHTLANASRLTRRKVLVGVCSEHDERLARQVAGDANSFVQVINLAAHVGSDPKLLPLALNAVMQRQAFFHDDDVLYFTEADQLLCGRDLDAHVRRMRAVPLGGAVLVPHRLEEMYRGHGVTRGMSASIHKRMYVLPNSDPKRTDAPGAVLPAGYNASAKTRMYYNAKSANEAYAAAFITEFRTYRRVPFMVHHGMPLESASFSVFYTGKGAEAEAQARAQAQAQAQGLATGASSAPCAPLSCIKTSEALSLYVIRLSGYEHHAKQANERIGEEELYIPPVHASIVYSDQLP